MPGRKELMDLLLRKLEAEVERGFNCKCFKQLGSSRRKINGPDNVYCRYGVPFNSICGYNIAAIILITYMYVI
jgi:hypothetical protein